MSSDVVSTDGKRCGDGRRLGSPVGAARLEMRLLLWDGGYFPVGLEFGVVGGVGAEGSVLPPHLQVLAGSRQLLHSLRKGRKHRRDGTLSLNCAAVGFFRFIWPHAASATNAGHVVKWTPGGATFATNQVSLEVVLFSFWLTSLIN